MLQSLPLSGYRWMTDIEIGSFILDDITNDGPKGYILSVDLEYPNELHNYTSDYPLAVEKFVVEESMLSNYTKNIIKQVYKGKYKPNKKLVPTLFNKTKYIVHFKTLKLYVELGLKITKIHRILQFFQSPWLADYVTYCTDKRIRASNKLQQKFWKETINFIYGKMIQGVKDKVHVEIVNNPVRLQKLVSKPTFLSFKIFSKDVAAVHMKKKKIILNKPIVVGFAILDIAKLKMYEFFYKYLKVLYKDKIKLLGSDTDSFIIEVESEDIFQDMYIDQTLFDTSNFPKDHYLYSEVNKCVTGKMKAEFADVIITKFCGLQSKVYGLQCLDENSDVKKAKGVPRCVLEKSIRFKHYMSCLFNNDIYYFSAKVIRSKNQVLYTMIQRKRSLQPADDKRWVLDHPSHQTLALGHYQIPILEYLSQYMQQAYHQ
jgi:hypothetical protein